MLTKNKKTNNQNLSLAIKAVKNCIRLLKKKPPKIKSIIGKEVKLNLDEKLNKIIIDSLKASEIPIISEEKSINENNYIIKNKKSFWIIDPLDGSLNYLRKIPMSTVSISLIVNNKPKISIIYEIFKNDFYLAYKNNILLNDKKIKLTRKFIKKKNGVLATGLPHKYDFSNQKINYKHFQKVRMIGCASLSLLGCALGKYDWYHEKNIMLWDVIAGYHFNLINKCKVKKFKINKLCQEVSLGYCI